MALDLSPGRNAALSIMDAQCTITRPDIDSPGMVDAVTLQRVHEALGGETIYEGPCFVGGVQGTQAEGADVEQGSIRQQVHVPVTAPEILRDDLVSVTDGGNDPLLDGQMFKVLEPSPVGSVVVWRRLACERIA